MGTTGHFRPYFPKKKSYQLATASRAVWKAADDELSYLQMPISRTSHMAYHDRDRSGCDIIVPRGSEIRASAASRMLGVVRYCFLLAVHTGPSGLG